MPKKEGIRVLAGDIARYLIFRCISPSIAQNTSTTPGAGTEKTASVPWLTPRFPAKIRIGGNYFHRWFLSATAYRRGLDRQHGNSTSPLLVGAPKGIENSTFLPYFFYHRELRFGYTDSIHFKKQNRIAERSLGTFFFLIYIDEFALDQRQPGKVS